MRETSVVKTSYIPLNSVGSHGNSSSAGVHRGVSAMSTGACGRQYVCRVGCIDRATEIESVKAAVAPGMSKVILCPVEIPGQRMCEWEQRGLKIVDYEQASGTCPVKESKPRNVGE